MFLKSLKAFSVYLRLKAVNLFSPNVQSKCLARSSVCFWVVLGIPHRVKSVRIRCYSGPHFSRIFPHSDWMWRDTDYLSVFSPNTRKCGKMDTSYAVYIFSLEGLFFTMIKFYIGYWKYLILSCFLYCCRY